MTRVKGGTAAHARHRKIRALAKGYRGKRHSTFRMANQAVMKAGMHAYVGRKQKKRDFRALWIVRISSGVAGAGDCDIRRSKTDGCTPKWKSTAKNLSELAIRFPAVFEQVVKKGQ